MTYIHNQTLLQTIINYFMQLATTLDDELVKIQNTINLINGEIPSKEVAAANQKVVVPASDTLMLINATIHNQTVILPKDANNPFQDCLVFEIGRIQCDSNPRKYVKRTHHYQILAISPSIILR